ncbi:extracellular solute-binding protein, partial [Candidatus Izimaplasma bacterium]|nr:extracellular solute-binding protein [Candidatus Izimaplasma bacterium]
MIRRRLMNIGLMVVLVTLVGLFIFKPFRTSDLVEWEKQATFDSYMSSLGVLQSTLEVPRNTYYDYLEEVTLDYDLPSTDAVLTAGETTETIGYTGDKVADLSTGNTAEYEVNITEEGYYTLDFDYIVTGTILNNITISIAIDYEADEPDEGFVYLFDDAKTVDVALFWEDSTKDFGVDTYGDETLPRQNKIEEWRHLDLYNNTYTSTDPLLFHFQQGLNTIQISNVSSGDLKLGDLELNPPIYIPSYTEYLAGRNTEASETNIVIDAIDYTEKNSSYVRLMAFGDPSVAPYDSLYKKLNVIDGGAWYKAGQEVSYEVTVEEDGLYDLTIHYANYKTDFEVFRSIKIDGEVPFREFSSYGIPHTPTNWDNHTLGQEDGDPYKVFLTAGTHTITFRAEKEELSRYLRDIQLMIDHINQFALEIIKITGKDIDRDRTWELTKFIPSTELYLTAYNTIIKYIVIELSQYSEKEDLSTTLSYLKKAVVEFEKMLEKPDELPLYLNNLYSGSSSVTLLLGDSLENIANQQLYLDSVIISNNGEYGPAKANFFRRTWDMLSGFARSYTTDKFKIENDKDAIDVWVNRPITYVDIMQKMVDATYTADTGIKVKISVMPDANKLILANSAGNTPDIALGLSAHMPFDLAIRGALQDLTEFDDFWEFSNNFTPGALIPYILEDGVYAVPETLAFNALVYRKDVFRSLELEVPDTWDDVLGILPKLQRYDMNFYYPTSG